MLANSDPFKFLLAIYTSRNKQNHLVGLEQEYESRVEKGYPACMLKWLQRHGYPLEI